MLVYSDADQVSLLPALAKRWSSGKLDGALLKGNIELKTLEWNKKAIKVVLSPAFSKQIHLNLPGPVEQVLVNGKAVSAASRKGNSLMLQLEKGKACRVEITMK